MANTTIKNRNQVKIVSFMKFAKKISDTFSTGQITVSTKVGPEGQEVTKYLNIQISSKIDLTEFNDKRVQLEGFFTGNMYKGNTSVRMFITSIRELEKGKGSSSVVFTTRTSFVREGQGDAKWTSAQGSLRFNAGTKTAENMQYANIGIRGSKETLKMLDGEIITVKGYLAAEFVPAKDDRKEFTRPVIVGLEVLERTGEGTAPQVAEASAPSTASAPAPQPETQAQPASEPGAINEDEIPF